MAAGWWQIRQLGDLRRESIPFLGWWTLLFLLFVLTASWAVHCYRKPGVPGERQALWMVLIGALLARWILLPLAPTLSDDIYRYLWDGRVQLAGLNPYGYAPADPVLAPLRDAAWLLINHRDIATIYPPVCQWLFRLAAMVAPTLQAQKIAFLLWDLATCALLIVVLPSWGYSPVLSLIYAWHPLIVTEFAASGHNDALGIFWLLLGLWLWTRRRRAWAAVAWGIGALAKIAPAMMLIWLLADRSRRRHALWFVLTVILGYAPFLGMLDRAALGLNHYAGQWEFNSSLYVLMAWLVREPWIARTLCMGLWGACAVWLGRRYEDPRRFAWTMTALAMLCSPVVEPWYVAWLVPLLCLYHRGPWLCFTGLVILSYEVLAAQAAHGTWCIEPWAQWLEYAPLYAWLLFEWWGMRRTVDVGLI